MNRIASLIAIATAALTLASAAGPAVHHADAKPQSKKQRCLTKGETVVRKGAYRLYVVESKRGEQFYFACLSSVGLHVLVSEDSVDELGTPRPIFAGKYVALEQTIYDEGGESGDAVTIFDLRSGKKVGGTSDIDYARAGFLPSQSGASGLRLMEDGRAAWVASGQDEGKRVVQIRTLVAGKAATLDSGSDVDGRSFTADTTTISWSNGGVAKTAPWQARGNR
jgi:hypothetical protein